MAKENENKIMEALDFCRDLAEEELEYAKVGTGAEVALRHIARRARESIAALEANPSIPRVEREEGQEVFARAIIKRVADAAIELAFVRHELTTTEQEETDYPDVEVAVETFKAFVEDVKADVLACLTGDEEGCLDPEDIDYDNELEWLKRQLANSTAEEEKLVDKEQTSTAPIADRKDI